MRINQQEGINSEINPLINSTCTSVEEDSIKFGVHADVENNGEKLQPLIIFEEHLDVMSCDQNDFVGNNDSYEVVYDLPVQIINKEPLIDTTHTLETVRNCQLTVTNSIVPSDNKNLHLLKENDCEAIDKQSSSEKKISPKAVRQGNIRFCLTNNL